MKIFFDGWNEIDAFLERLLWMRCPACGAIGVFGRHGFIRGLLDDSQDNDNIRARRIRCRPEKGGCGKTWSLRPGDRLFRYCFGTKQAWAFLRGILRGRSVKAAWEDSGIRLSLECAYRLLKRFKGVASVLRTRLFSRAPPTASDAPGSDEQTLEHLQALHGREDPLKAFQLAYQAGFLARR